MSSRTAAGAVLVAAVFLVFRSWYFQAGLEELRWFLAPTVALAEWFSGLSFQPHTRHGYLGAGGAVAIGKSCGGANFLSIVFLLGAYSVVPRARSAADQLGAVAVLAVTAFTVTTFANASRITAAILLLKLRPDPVWPTADHLHLGAGLAVYSVFLVLFHLAAEETMKRGNR
jgi:exosortase K